MLVLIFSCLTYKYKRRAFEFTVIRSVMTKASVARRERGVIITYLIMTVMSEARLFICKLNIKYKH